MMSKKVTFGTKPRERKAQTPEEWISGGANSKSHENREKQEVTRFTIDIPSELHARIKSQCALKKVKMRDEIQALLERHFAAS